MLAEEKSTYYFVKHPPHPAKIHWLRVCLVVIFEQEITFFTEKKSILIYLDNFLKIIKISKKKNLFSTFF